MQEAGLTDALEVLRKEDVLYGLPRISMTALSGILSYCQSIKYDAENEFYPVFTDKSDHSMEMQLLGVCLQIEAMDGTLRKAGEWVKKIDQVAAAHPRFTFWDRIRKQPAIGMSSTTAEGYQKSLEALGQIKNLPLPGPLSGSLSQDQYIRSMGLLERIHPRPVSTTLNRGSGTNLGNPPLTPLVRGSDQEEELHWDFYQKQERHINRKYQDYDALQRFAGKRALEILSQPRDETLVAEIEAIQLVEENLRDIVLRNYQRFGAKFILARKRVVIGDEMGLGKTIQALAVMAHLENDAKKSGRVFKGLVVCPASIRINWKREIERFTSFTTVSLKGKDALNYLEDWNQNGGVAITSYESMKWFPHEPLDICVIDEAQYIKNPNAQRSENCRRVLKDARYGLCMTGTPIENNLEEFLNIFDAVREHSGSEMRALLLESEDPARFATMVQSLYLRRTKQDVLTELPSLNLVLEEVELTEEELNRHVDDITDVRVHFMKVRQNLNHPDESGASKMARVISLVEEYTENKRNVIIFSYFREPIEWLCSRFGSVFVVHGGIHTTKRQETIDQFSLPLSDGEPGRVMVAQIKSGGVGLNIQAASAVILLEPQFNPAVEVQAISRVHRMGQRRSVDVHRIICQDTIEELLLERLYQKQEIMDLYADDCYIKHLTPDATDRDTRVGEIVAENEVRSIATERIRKRLRDAS